LVFHVDLPARSQVLYYANRQNATISAGDLQLFQPAVCNNFQPFKTMRCDKHINSVAKATDKKEKRETKNENKDRIASCTRNNISDECLNL